MNQATQKKLSKNLTGAKKYVPACLLLGPPAMKANRAQSKQKMNLVWLWLSYRRCGIGYKSSKSRAQSPERQSVEGSSLAQSSRDLQGVCLGMQILAHRRTGPNVPFT